MILPNVGVALGLVVGVKVGDLVGIAVGVAEGFDVGAVDLKVDKQLIMRERGLGGEVDD